ncbi:MAG: CBS domain-containing protein [Methyloceanibacter sp.]
MTTVKHVLDKKGNDVHFIHPGASVFDALKLMAEHDIGSLVVLGMTSLSASSPNGITRGKLF